MRYYLLLVAISWCIITTGFSQKKQKISIDLQGTLELNYINYFHKKANKINSRQEGTFVLQSTIRFDDEATFKTVIESRKDLQDNYRDRLGYVREAYFHFVDRKMDIKIGKQIVNWGTADMYNPNNNINPIDYTDFFELENNQLGVWMVSAKRFHKHNKFTEVLVNPALPRLAVPNFDSRWVLGLPQQMPNPLDVEKMLPILYSYDKLQPSYRDVGFMIGVRNGIAANNWDISKSILIGANYTPSFSNSLIGIDTSGVQVSLQPVYQRLYALGFDFATTFKNFGLRGELALKGLSEPNSKQGLATLYYEYTIGIDRTFNQLLFDKNVMVLLQWVRQQILRTQEPMENDIRFFLQKALLLRTELAISYYSSFAIQTLYTLDAQNVYIRPSLKYRILNGLTITTLADLLFGKSNGFLGQYLENDRWQIRLTYDF